MVVALGLVDAPFDVPFFEPDEVVITCLRLNSQIRQKLSSIGARNSMPHNTTETIGLSDTASDISAAQITAYMINMSLAMALNIIRLLICKRYFISTEMAAIIVVRVNVPASSKTPSSLRHSFQLIVASSLRF